MDETQFHPNDRVFHPIFGYGTVVEVGEDSEQLSVHFDGYATKWLALKYAFLRLVTPEEEASETARAVSWLDTFVFEEEGDHYFGTRWTPFFDDAEGFFQRLPEILPKAIPLQGYGDFFPPPHQCPPDWSKVRYLAWPDVHQAVLLAIKENEGRESELVSLFPHCRSGVEHTVTIERVLVWKDGCKAQIEGVVGPACITFFDTLYGVNRGWYESGRDLQFILTGIAYDARKAPIEEFDIPPSEVDASIREKAKQNGIDLAELPSKIDTRHMQMLLPIPDWDRDDYQFHGPVKSVKETVMLNQPGWLVRTALVRGMEDDREYDFDILITRKAWEGDEPPRAGENIEGAMWLQGYLWSAR